MKKEQIDNFFVKAREIWTSKNDKLNEKILIELFKLSSENIKNRLKNKKISELEEKDYDDLFKNIIEQIQNSNLYEYFLETGIEKGNIPIFEKILPKDIKLPIKIVEGVIRNDDLSAELVDIDGFIEKTKDIGFIEKCIYDRTLFINRLHGISRMELLKATTEDIEFLRKSLTDEDIFSNYTNSRFLEQVNSMKKANLIILTKNVDFIKECLQNEKLKFTIDDTTRLIRATKDKEYIKECIQNKKYKFTNRNLTSLIIATEDEDFIKECVNNDGLRFDGEYKMQLIKATNDKEFIKECVLQKDKYKIDLLTILGFLIKLEDKDRFDILAKFENKNERAYIVKFLRTISNSFSNKITIENLELIMQCENVENSHKKAKILMELIEKNQDVLKNIDFKLLDDIYINLLGKEKINWISNFSDIQNKIINLNETESKTYAKLIGEYEKEGNENDWKYLTNNILENISEYKDLVEEIDYFTQDDIKSAISIIQNQNNFALRSLEDLRNYKRIKQNTCDEWIYKSEDTTRKKEALLYKIFGQDINYTEKILR